MSQASEEPPEQPERGKDPGEDIGGGGGEGVLLVLTGFACRPCLHPSSRLRAFPGQRAEERVDRVEPDFALPWPASAFISLSSFAFSSGVGWWSVPRNAASWPTARNSSGDEEAIEQRAG